MSAARAWTWGQYCCSLHLFARPAVRLLRGKLRLLDQLLRSPVDLDQVMGGGEGGGKDSSWSLVDGCNHLSRLVAILILSIPGQAQLASAPTAARHLPPAGDEKTQALRYLDSVPGCRWYLRHPQLCLMRMLTVVCWNEVPCGTWLVAGNVLGL